MGAVLSGAGHSVAKWAGRREELSLGSERERLPFGDILARVYAEGVRGEALLVRFLRGRPELVEAGVAEVELFPIEHDLVGPLGCLHRDFRKFRAEQRPQLGSLGIVRHESK